MSTANFKTMDDFKLCVAESPYMRVCPECGIANEEKAETCAYCGADLSSVSPVYDDISMADMVKEMQAQADDINSSIRWHKVSVQSGYYSGVQFYIEETMDAPETLTNEECKEYYNYDMCRSKAIRAHKAEVNHIRKWLAKTAAYLGLTTLRCLGHFLNGEAVYEKVA